MGVNHWTADTNGRDYRRLHGDDVHAGVFSGADPYSDGDYPHYVRRVCVGGVGVEDCADLDVVRRPGTKGKRRWEKPRVWVVFDRVGVYWMDDCKWDLWKKKKKGREREREELTGSRRVFRI